jgi:TolA-binding protein
MTRLRILLLATALVPASIAFAQDAVPAGTATPPEPTPTETSAAATPAATTASTTAAPLPTFLDTTDRRIVDDRVPPSKEQIAALEEMEREVERYVRSGGSYRDTVGAIVRREYLRQRRVRDENFSGQIGDEEKLLAESRDRAIELFEKFVDRYPNDPTYTPDAMFRLGELYFERSYEEFYAQQNDPNAVTNAPDFTSTVELYQQLVRRFPEYARIDGVYYLIGYCLSEMGKSDEARMAWLNLVCANKFKYDPDAAAAAPAPDSPEAIAAAEEAKKHPAVTLDAKSELAAAGVFLDPYAECKPVVANAKFLSETWFRVGEYHFDDYGGEHSVELAISAYSRILTDPTDRNFSLALYKVAWAHYRASNYPEAIKRFAELVQYSDDEQKRTGEAGSQLRPEAVQYLGIAFAYDDWNENQTPDTKEGQPSGIKRIQDAALLAQDREWTAEVYFQLGDVYFDEAKYPEAIEIWELAMQKWPTHSKAPEYTNMIARAYTRHNEMEEAIEWRAKLGDFGEGSTWWNANLDNPSEQRRAEELAESALINSALYYHQQAQELRRRCVAEQNIALCNEAQDNYKLAGKAYRGYLDRYPNNPEAYELRYNLADSLYWSENYDQAAIEYATVRDSNLDDKHLSESARRVVESVQRVVDAEVAAGRLVIPKDAPVPVGTPPAVTPAVMPELLQRLAQARELYIARVDDKADKENVREAYEFNNALLLYLYGYWPQAKERFARIYDERCRGPYADETGRIAWTDLRNMAVSLKDDAEVERLATDFQKRQCTFTPDGQQVAQVDCAKSENKDQPQCLVAGDLNALRYRKALDIYRKAEKATGDEQRELYESAATTLVKAVNENPGDKQAPLALEYAATALERTSRFESAARLYQRIIDEVGPRKPENAQEQGDLDAILSNAYFRLAFNSNRFFDFERAVENYKLIADSQRFAQSKDPNVLEKREDALINAGLILENLQQYSRAADYYKRAADTVRDADTRRNARYKVAEMALKRGNINEAKKAMRAFIGEYERDPKAGEIVMTAYWNLAELEKKSALKTYLGSLGNVVDAYKRTGQKSGSISAEYAAHSEFIRADQNIGAFESFKVTPGKPATLKDYVGTLGKQIDDGAKQTQTLVKAYEPIPAYGRPTWTVASLVRSGRVYEVLARAILNAPFVMPADLQKKLKQVDEDAREQIRLEVEGAVQQTLDTRVRPIECFAVARYALAVRAAKAGNLDNEYTQIAVDRLQAYGDERIGECIAEAQKTDANFGAYQTGEFTRAPRGKLLKMPDDVSPPALAPVGGRK